MRTYILRETTPVLVSMEEWSRVWHTVDRKVARDTIYGNGVAVTISTVFLGIDHSFNPSGPPLIFETMIFGGREDGLQDRYSTWNEAMLGHLRALRSVLKEASDAPVLKGAPISVVRRGGYVIPERIASMPKIPFPRAVEWTFTAATRGRLIIDLMNGAGEVVVNCSTGMIMFPRESYTITRPIKVFQGINGLEISTDFPPNKDAFDAPDDWYPVFRLDGPWSLRDPEMPPVVQPGVTRSTATQPVQRVVVERRTRRLITHENEADPRPGDDGKKL